MAEEDPDSGGPADPRTTILNLANKIAAARDADILLLNTPIRYPLDFRVLRLLRSRTRRTNLLAIIVTEGGDANQAFRVSRFFQDLYEGLFTAAVSGWCKSAGTLICIGANNLLMGDLGELGPLDVQIARTDDLVGRSSGLTDEAAFRTLQSTSFNLFEQFLLDLTSHSGGRITLKTAAEVSANMTVGLLEPIFAQFDPKTIGDNYRSTQVANEYAHRLNIVAGNMPGSEEIGTLVSGYPSHGFVIDRTEAGTLFRSVHPMEGDLAELIELLQLDAIIPADPAIIRFLNDEGGGHGTAKQHGSASDGGAAGEPEKHEQPGEPDRGLSDDSEKGGGDVAIPEPKGHEDGTSDRVAGENA